MGLYPNCQMTSFFMKEITLVCDFLLFMRMTFCIISKKTKLHTQKKLLICNRFDLLCYDMFLKKSSGLRI